MNWEKTLDNVLYTMMILSGLLWEDLPADVKAKMLMALRGNEVCIMGYNKQLIKGGE